MTSNVAEIVARWADGKLGHASATKTIDRCGHLIDGNLWGAAVRVSARGHLGGTESTQLIKRDSV